MFTMRWDYICWHRTMGDSRLSPGSPLAAPSITLGLWAGRLWPGRGAAIQVIDVFHQFIIFFQLRRICNCCNNIFSDPTTILTEQRRYWSWEIALINRQTFADPLTLCGQDLPSLGAHIMFTMRRDYICWHRTMGDSRLSIAPPLAAPSKTLVLLRLAQANYGHCAVTVHKSKLLIYFIMLG